MMAFHRRPALAIAAALAFLLLASAPGANASIFGCTPCASCPAGPGLFATWCWRTCSPSCSYTPFTPNNIIVSGDVCASAGTAYAPTAGANACEFAKSSCSELFGSAAQQNGFGAIGPVALSQCSNIAMGTCQQGANLNSCGGAAELGYGSCDAATFRQYFAAAAASTCRSFAQSVTGVAPGTNSWAPSVIGASAPSSVVVGASAPSGGSGSDDDSSDDDSSDDDSSDDGSSDDSSGNRRHLLAAGRRMLRAAA